MNVHDSSISMGKDSIRIVMKKGDFFCTLCTSEISFSFCADKMQVYKTGGMCYIFPIRENQNSWKKRVRLQIVLQRNSRFQAERNMQGADGRWLWRGIAKGRKGDFRFQVMTGTPVTA